MFQIGVAAHVFHIKGAAYGTAFAIDVAGRQYLVTARHLLESEPTAWHAIGIFGKRQWHRLRITLVGVGHDDVDVAVLAARQKLVGTELDVGGQVHFGEDVYFLGYPYGMWTDAGELTLGWPMPFVKKGLLSSVDNSDSKQILYIHAINNQGFSGGPILGRQMIGGLPKYRVLGVVSGYRIQHEPVLDEFGDKTTSTVPTNSGFLIGHGIKTALDLIERNPVGYELSSDAKPAAQLAPEHTPPI